MKRIPSTVLYTPLLKQEYDSGMRDAINERAGAMGLSVASYVRHLVRVDLRDSGTWQQDVVTKYK